MIDRNPTQPWRIGLVVVDNDPIPELEIRPAEDGHITVVASRFLLNRAHGEVYMGEGDHADVPLEMCESLQQLDRIGVDAVGLCFTSSSVFAPATFDRLFTGAAHKVNEEWMVATAAEVSSTLSPRPRVPGHLWLHRRGSPMRPSMR